MYAISYDIHCRLKNLKTKKKQKKKFGEECMKLPRIDKQNKYIKPVIDSQPIRIE